LFAAALVRAFPHLPIEEEGRLNDGYLRESFIERVFAYKRLQGLWATRWTLVRHYVRTLKVEYLLGQTYLDPHPKELMLRNRV